MVLASPPAKRRGDTLGIRHSIAYANEGFDASELQHDWLNGLPSLILPSAWKKEEFHEVRGSNLVSSTSRRMRKRFRIWVPGPKSVSADHIRGEDSLLAGTGCCVST